MSEDSNETTGPSQDWRFKEKSIAQHPDIKDLLTEREVRPSPVHVAQLIRQGLTEADILAQGQELGYESPEMSLTLTELNNATPYIRKIVDNLAETYGDRRIFFLARDSELLYDAYTTLHPDKEARLLPASMSLLRSDDMKDAKKANDFFNDNGLDDEVVNGDTKKALLMDSGFVGRAGHQIWYLLSQLHGRDFEDVRAQIPIKLVSAYKSEGPPEYKVGDFPPITLRWGEALMDFDSDEELAQSDSFPKVTSLIGPYKNNDRFMDERDPLAHRLSIALQLMPHHNDAFTRLIEKDGHEVAVSGSDAPIRQDVDDVMTEGRDTRQNPSCVNPLAALIVQYRLIKNLLV